MIISQEAIGRKHNLSMIEKDGPPGAKKKLLVRSL